MKSVKKNFGKNGFNFYFGQIAVLIFTLFLAINSYGKVQKVNGIKWTYDVVRGSAVVRSVPKTTKGAITIPSKLGGYPVKAIAGQTSRKGVGAFGNCKQITSITIPTSVEAIGTRAFYNCSRLKKITFLGDHPYFDFDYSIRNYSHYVRYGAETFEKIPSSCTVYIPKGRDWSRWVSDLKSRVRRVKNLTTYYVSFKANGGKGKMTNQSITYGKTVKLNKNAFSRSKYVFAGWAKSKTGAVAYVNQAKVKNLISTGSTRTLYARWAKSKYKIAFYPNGGAGKAVTQTFTYGKATKLRANTFKRTGYVFAGWAKSKTGAVAYSNKKAVKNLTMTGATIKLYAVWRAISTYKYNANGGYGTMPSQTFTYGTKSTLRSNAFKRTGYTFAGWATTPKGTVKYKNRYQFWPSSKPSTVTLYAVWKANTYKIVFNANGGKGSMAALTVTYDKSTPLKLNTFERDNYTFAGWATTSTGTVKYKNGVAVKNLTASGSYSLYAVWSAKTTVEFFPNGAPGATKTQGIYYGEPQKLGYAFKRDGYTFTGWATTPSGAVKYKDRAQFWPSSKTPTTVRLYAVWKANTYKIVFNANSGKGSMPALTVTYDAPIQLTQNKFTRTGYTFAGWAKSKTGAIAYKDTQSVKNLQTSGTITLYAVWKANTYKIEFNPNGGEGNMAPLTATYDEPIQLTTNSFKRTGYVFIGWAKSETGAVAYTDTKSVENLATFGTITLYAVWEYNCVTIIFNANGGSSEVSMEPQKISFEDTPASLNECTYKLNECTYKRKDYQFVGWATSSNSTEVVFKERKEYKKEDFEKHRDEFGTIKLYAMWELADYMVVNIDPDDEDVDINYYSDIKSVTNSVMDHKKSFLVLRKVKQGADTYYMGIYEVTEAQIYNILKLKVDDAYALQGVSAGSLKPCSVSYEQMTKKWSSSINYTVLGILQEKTKLDFNLPTTNQWAYVCPANSNNSTNLAAIAWYGGSEADVLGAKEVGSKNPDEAGFYDMYGNVWEICLPEADDPDMPIKMGGAYDSKLDDFKDTIPYYLIKPNESDGKTGVRLVVPITTR